MCKVFNIFLRWMWELDYKESWVLRNWCFWPVVLEKTLESPWTARRSNQSILKEISPEYSLERLIWSWNSNTLATWCEEMTHLKRSWCWEKLRAGREGENRGWDGWMASLTQWTWVWVNSRSWWWTGRPVMLQSMGLQSRTWLSNWTEDQFIISHLAYLLPNIYVYFPNSSFSYSVLPLCSICHAPNFSDTNWYLSIHLSMPVFSQ